MNDDDLGFEPDEDDDLGFEPEAYAAAAPEENFGTSLHKSVRSGVKALAETAGKGFEYVDRYTHAPVRAGVGEYQKSGDLGTSFGAAGSQFGEPTAGVPTSRDLMAKFGASTEAKIPFPMMEADPEKGFRTMKVSPAGVLGAGFDMATDPLSIAPLGPAKKAVSMGLKAAERAAPALARGVQKAGTTAIRAAEYPISWAGKLATGVDPKDIRRFMSDPKRISAAPGIEEIKDSIDSGVGARRADFDKVTEALGSSKEAMQRAYQGKLDELRQKTIPVSAAEEMTGLLKGEKEKLGALSRETDEILGKAGGSIDKRHLLDVLDQVGGSVGVGQGKTILSKKTEGAVKALHDWRQRIAGMPEESLDYGTLRDVLTEMRKDLNYSYGSGEFNAEFDRLGKQVAEKVSGLLKTDVPEYADKMSQMRDLSQNLGDLDTYFGDRGKALASLEAATGAGDSPRARLMRDILARHGKLSGKSELLSKMDDYSAKNRFLEETRRTDMSRQLLPENASRLDDLEGLQQMARQLHEPVERLGENRTQSVIKNQGGKNASIEDRRSLEALGKMEGRDYLTDIADRKTLDSFDKEYTQGSRRAVLGGAMGSLFGPVGTAIGGGVGAGLDAFGPKMLKGAISATGGSATAQKAVSAVSNLLQRSPQAMAKYQDVFARAAQRGPQAIAVTHHLLMNNDLEYRTLVLENSDTQGVPAE